MQLLDILSALNPRELLNLNERVKKQKRPPLHKLFQELKKLRNGKTAYEKEQIFKAVYGKPFNKKKEYVLKNDTRALKQIVYRFLVDEELNRELKENEYFYNEWLLKGLIKRRATNVFVKEVDKAIREAEKQQEHDALAKFLRLKIDYHLLLANPNFFTKEQRLSLLDDIQHADIKHLLYMVRDLENRRAFVLRQALAAEDPEKYTDITLDMEVLNSIDLNEYEDDMTYQYGVMRDMHLLSGETKLQKQKEYLDWLRKSGTLVVDHKRIEMTLLVNIAVALLNMNNYAEAEHYLNEAEEVASLNKLEANTLYQTHMLCFLLSGKYKAAIDYYEDNREGIQKNRFFDEVTYRLCFAYLFLEDAGTAVRLAINYLSQLDKTTIDDLPIKQRFIYITAHIIDKDYEAAYRELVNYTKSTLYKSDKREWTTRLVDLYKKYLDIKSGHKHNSEDLLQQLYNELDQLPGHMEKIALEFPWLKRKVAKDLASRLTGVH